MSCIQGIYPFSGEGTAMQGSCSCTIPIGLQPSPHLKAPAEGTATALAHVPARGEAACLGRSALAAYTPAPRLPGAGVLLPAWRQLAQLLALMNHQVPIAAQHAHMLWPLLFQGHTCLQGAEKVFVQTRTGTKCRCRLKSAVIPSTQRILSRAF